MRIFTFLICLVFISLDLAAQNLIIMEDDVLFRGKIRVTADTNSIFLGDGAGLSIDETQATLNTFIGTSTGNQNTAGRYNTFIGGLTGFSNSTGSENVMIGFQAGQFTDTGDGNVYIGHNTGFASAMGDDNTFVGNHSGFKNTMGGTNTYIGALAGYNNTMGSGNVFLGHRAGQLELGSNKLYINNSSTSEPLLYGDFGSNTFRVNGSAQIRDFMQLEPGSAPLSPVKGTIYYDQTDDKVKVWTGAVWENLN